MIHKFVWASTLRPSGPERHLKILHEIMARYIWTGFLHNFLALSSTKENTKKHTLKHPYYSLYAYPKLIGRVIAEDKIKQGE